MYFSASFLLNCVALFMSVIITGIPRSTFTYKLSCPTFCITYKILTAVKVVSRIGLVREIGLATYIPRYSDFIASRQRFRRFTQMKRKWWFREGGSNIQLQSQSLLFYLILNYPEIYIYFYVLLFPTKYSIP